MLSIIWNWGQEEQIQKLCDRTHACAHMTLCQLSGIWASFWKHWARTVDFNVHEQQPSRHEIQLLTRHILCHITILVRPWISSNQVLIPIILILLYADHFWTTSWYGRDIGQGLEYWMMSQPLKSIRMQCWELGFHLPAAPVIPRLGSLPYDLFSLSHQGHLAMSEVISLQVAHGQISIYDEVWKNHCQSMLLLGTCWTTPIVRIPP